jgi:GNAT superfamily N-acetyltransferase
MTPDKPMPAIIRAGAEHIDKAAALITDAFFDLPATRWLVPEIEHRPMVLRSHFAILIEHALHHGHIDLVADGSAVAVWFDRTQPVPAPHNYAERLAAACGPYAHHFTKLDELFDIHHPRSEHHHLALLAVTPSMQRQGLGSRLLAHHHAHLNQHDIPAYLEASSIPSRELYLRLGYRSGIPFSLPNGALFWPMWREPR